MKAKVMFIEKKKYFLKNPITKQNVNTSKLICTLLSLWLIKEEKMLYKLTIFLNHNSMPALCMLCIALKEKAHRRIHIKWVCFLPTSNWKTGRKKESHFNSLDKVPMGSAIIAKHSTWKTPFSKPTMTFQHLPIFFAPLHTEYCWKDQFFNSSREFFNISYVFVIDLLSFDKFFLRRKITLAAF